MQQYAHDGGYIKGYILNLLKKLFPRQFLKTLCQGRSCMERTYSPHSPSVGNKTKFWGILEWAPPPPPPPPGGGENSSPPFRDLSISMLDLLNLTRLVLTSPVQKKMRKNALSYSIMVVLSWMSPPGKGIGANFHCKPRYHYLLSQVTIHALNPVMVTVSCHRQANGPLVSSQAPLNLVGLRLRKVHWSR